MKSKKLLILIASIAAVVVVICILAAVFSIKKPDSVQLVYHGFDGKTIAAPDEGGIASDEVFKFVKGKSAMFLSKTKLMNQINETYTKWHAFEVVKNFPNIVEIHLVKRIAIVKVNVGGKDVFIDNFGYVAEEPENGRIVDATSAFNGTDVNVAEAGKKFEFATAANNGRLDCVIEALMATWQCNVDTENLATLLGDVNVFSFDDDGAMLIKPVSGGTIRVLSPQTNLTARLIKAYGVYYTDYANLQDDSWVITVRDDDEGTITTPNPDNK